jgi:hypothetical protein
MNNTLAQTHTQRQTHGEIRQGERYSENEKEIRFILKIYWAASNII